MLNEWLLLRMLAWFLGASWNILDYNLLSLVPEAAPPPCGANYEGVNLGVYLSGNDSV